MVAFSVSKLKWRGRGLVFTLVIASMMIPYQVTMIPIYMAWNRIGLVDTYVPLILVLFCTVSVRIPSSAVFPYNSRFPDGRVKN